MLAAEDAQDQRDRSGQPRPRGGHSPPETRVAHSWQSPWPTVKVICSLCEREGRPGSLGEREPFDNPAVTHGLCAPHKELLLESIPSRSFPDVELLIVVRLNDTALYEYLRQSFAGVHRVKVIADRRRWDRRREQRLMTDDRRQKETRRIRQGKVSPLGYTVVRFRRKSEP